MSWQLDYRRKKYFQRAMFPLAKISHFLSATISTAVFEIFSFEIWKLWRPFHLSLHVKIRLSPVQARVYKQKTNFHSILVNVGKIWSKFNPRCRNSLASSNVSKIYLRGKNSWINNFVDAKYFHFRRPILKSQ